MGFKIYKMNGFLSFNSKLISVLITPSSGNAPASVTFPTEQDLENRKIVGIECFNIEDVSLDPLNSGVPNLTPAQFAGAFLTVYTSAVTGTNAWNKLQEPGLFYDKIPLSRLRHMHNSDVTTANINSDSRSLFLIRPTEFSFNKTKVEFPSPISMTEQHSAIFQVHYLDKNDDGSEWMKFMGFK